MPGACWSTSGHERLVKAPCVSHGTKAAQGVGQHDGAGIEVAPGPGGDLLAAKRRCLNVFDRFRKEAVRVGMRLRAGDGVYTSRTMPDATGENRSRFGQSFRGKRGGASVGRWDHSDAAAVLLEDAIGLHLILPSPNRPVRRTGLKMATRTRTRAARQVRCLEAWSRFPTALHSRAIEAEGEFP